MEKNVLKSLLFSILTFFLVSCSIPPTYSRKEIEEILKSICKKEYDIDVNVWDTGSTVWIYTSLDLVDESGKWNMDEDDRWNEEVSERLRRISFSLKRVLLSLDRVPEFYCFVKSDIEEIGVDWYVAVFVRDEVKYDTEMRMIGRIPSKTIQERIVSFACQDSQALGDKEGTHINRYNISMEEFISLVIDQNIEKEFASKEVKDKFQINDLAVDCSGEQLSISLDIEIKEETEETEKTEEPPPSPIEKAEEITKKILNFYSSFHEITAIQINDTLNNETKNFDFSPDGTKIFSASDTKTKAADTLNGIRRTNRYIIKGKEYYAEGDFEKAAAYYQKALNINSENLNILIGLSNAYFALNQHKKALAPLKRILEITPDDSNARQALGMAHMFLGQYQEAIGHLEKALETYPNKDRVYYNIGIAWANLGKYKQAITYFQKALEINKDHLDAYHELGMIYYHSGNYELAIANYKKAIEVNPEYFKAYYNIAHTYSTLRKYKEAVDYYQKALELNPDSVNTRSGLGAAYYHLKQYKEAKTYFEGAFKANPDNIQICYNLGYICFILKQYQEALGYFQKTTESAPSYTAAYVNIAVIYNNLNKPKEAKQYFQKAKELFQNQKNHRAVQQMEVYLRQFTPKEVHSP